MFKTLNYKNLPGSSSRFLLILENPRLLFRNISNKNGHRDICLTPPVTVILCSGPGCSVISPPWPSTGSPSSSTRRSPPSTWLWRPTPPTWYSSRGGFTGSRTWTGTWDRKATEPTQLDILRWTFDLHKYFWSSFVDEGLCEIPADVRVSRRNDR